MGRSIIVVLIAVSAAALGAQQQLSPAKGTGVIRGRVVDAQSNRPLKDVAVTVDITGVRGFLTGSDGAFVLRDLAADSYMLSAAKPGYFTSGYGQRRPSGTRVPIELGEGQRREDVTVAMWTHGTIGGKVADETGRPVGGVAVRVTKMVTSNGVLLASTTSTIVMTDDIGVYRAAELAPGAYVVAVIPQYGTRELTAPPSAASARAGAVLAADGRTEISTFGLPIPPPSRDGRLRLYPATYATSARSPDDAQVVTLGAGEAREDVDVELRPVAAVRVSGVVTGSNGPIGAISLRLLASSGDPAWITATTTSSTDGSFSFLTVPAGSYTVEALRQQNGPNTRDAEGLRGVMPLVLEKDVTDVVVTMRAGVSVSGRYLFDGDFPAAGRKDITAFLDPVGSQGTVHTLVPGVPLLDNSSDRFTLTGVQPGQYLVGVVGLPPGWMFSRVISSGRNVAFTPLDVGNADVSDLEITLTTRLTGVTGAVRDARGAVTSVATVVIFPADRSSWILGPRSDHQLRSLRAPGQYTIENLPPGDYLIAAVDDALMDQWPDISLLASIAARATRVSIADGDRKTVDLVFRER